MVMNTAPHVQDLCVHRSTANNECDNHQYDHIDKDLLNDVITLDDIITRHVICTRSAYIHHSVTHAHVCHVYTN